MSLFYPGLCKALTCEVSWPNLDLKFLFKPACIRKENTGLSHFKFVEDAVDFATGHFWLLTYLGLESFQQLGTLFPVEPSRTVT